jgi:hypothetical protein
VFGGLILPSVFFPFSLPIPVDHLPDQTLFSFMPHYRHYHLRSRMKKWARTYGIWLFWALFILLNTMISSSIHFPANDIINFSLWLNNILWYICICMYVCICTYIYKYKENLVYMCVYTHIYVYIYTHIHIYIHTHTYIYIYIHTHIYQTALVFGHLSWLCHCA